MGELSTYSIIIDSQDRISGTPDNFVVNFTPVIQRVKSIELESVSLPFNFNNVTATYGSGFNFTLSGTYGVSAQLSIIPGFYTLVNLLAAINEELVIIFNAVMGGMYPCPISFTLAPIPNRVLLNYNSTNFGGNPAVLTFIPPPIIPGTGIQPNYLYKMLGLNPTSNTVFTYPNTATMWVNQLPHPATAQLPISYVLMFIQGLPAKVISSSQIGAQFYIDVTGATVLGNQIALPNSFKANRDYYNRIELQDNYFNFQELTVIITDNEGQSLLIDQNVTEWHFSFKVETYK